MDLAPLKAFATWARAALIPGTTDEEACAEFLRIVTGRFAEVRGHAVVSTGASRDPVRERAAAVLSEEVCRDVEVVGWDGPLRGRGLARLRRVAVLGDGARWIWELAAEHFGERVEIVDYYHAAQHLWDVARALRPDDPAAAAAWAFEVVS